MPESSERGALTEAVFYILLSLHSPMHGYGIMQNIKQMSSGRVSLGAGTLYGAINALLTKGWIVGIENYSNQAASNTRKKEYVITDSGKKSFEEELVRLNELLTNGRTIIGGANTGNGNQKTLLEL